jgi:hypothetical protein
LQAIDKCVRDDEAAEVLDEKGGRARRQTWQGGESSFVSVLELGELAPQAIKIGVDLANDGADLLAGRKDGERAYGSEAMPLKRGRVEHREESRGRVSLDRDPLRDELAHLRGNKPARLDFIRWLRPLDDERPSRTAQCRGGIQELRQGLPTDGRRPGAVPGWGSRTTPGRKQFRAVGPIHWRIVSPRSRRLLRILLTPRRCRHGAERGALAGEAVTGPHRPSG